MTESLLAVAALAAPLCLFVVALVARSQPGRAPRLVQRALGLASGLGVGVAIASAVSVAFFGPLKSGLLGVAELGASTRLDGLSVTIFTMVALLALVIGRFSSTYLEGDARHGTFLGRLALTAAAVETLVLAGNIALCWFAWVATSAFLHGLLVFYSDRPRAVIAARKKFVAARLGDASLAGAFALLYSATGSGELDALFVSGVEGSPTALAIAPVLLAATALLKSAQFPTHGWLVEVMETPTPVSALLHAGILNAGPFLILRFSPLMVEAELASWVLLVGGGVTAVFASVVLRTQPSVKVALGYSSAAHMGFMLFVCGLGVYPAAALHLVAHSFYKAHAFLSAGSVVDASQAARVTVPRRLHHPGRVVVGLFLALITYGAVAHLLGLEPWKEPSLVAVGAIVVLGLTQLIGAGLDAKAPVSTYAQVVGAAVVVALAFFGLEEGARLLLLDSLPALTTPPVSALALGAVIVAGFALTTAVQLTAHGRKSGFGQRLRVHLRHGFYANALFDRLVGGLSRPTTP